MAASSGAPSAGIDGDQRRWRRQRRLDLKLGERKEGARGRKQVSAGRASGRAGHGVLLSFRELVEQGNRAAWEGEAMAWRQ